MAFVLYVVNAVNIDIIQFISAITQKSYNTAGRICGNVLYLYIVDIAVLAVNIITETLFKGADCGKSDGVVLGKAVYIFDNYIVASDTKVYAVGILDVYLFECRGCSSG